MTRLSFSLSIVVCFSLVRFIGAQCVTDGYVPCYPTGGSDSGGSGGSDSGASGGSDSGASGGSDSGASGGSDSGGSGGLPLDDGALPAEFDTLNNAVDTDLAKRGVAPRLLLSRQNALCCSPTDRCLVFTDGNIPFCYVSILYLPSFFLLIFYTFFSAHHYFK